MKKNIWIGAHVSCTGGVAKALYEAKELGANAVQIFTGSLMHTKKFLSKQEINAWFEAQKKTKMTMVMSHASYLINLGSPDKKILNRERNALKNEIRRCHQLKIPYLCVHIGKADGAPILDCLERSLESLRKMKSILKKGNTRILIENSAGDGTAIGDRFEHLSFLIQSLKDEIPIGVCLDTCHLFGSGYDIRTTTTFEQTLNYFDRVVGLQHLLAFHINDSKTDFNKRKDIHAPIGKGKIGIHAFQFLMKHPKTKFIPKFLETQRASSTAHLLENNPKALKAKKILKKEITQLFKFANK